MSVISSSKCLDLYNAASRGNAAEVERLLSDPEVDPDGIIVCEMTPFVVACQRGSFDIVRLFLECKKPIEYNHRSRRGWSVVHCAAYWGYADILRLLTDDPRIDLNLPNDRLDTPLHCSYWDVERTMILLSSERCTYVDAPDSFGKTPLQLAASKGYDAVASIIKDHIKDPVASRAWLREELGGYPEYYAGELFAIGVLLCDGYLSLA